VDDTFEGVIELMLEFIKKGLLAGIGAVVLTKEKVEEVTRRLVEEGKISTEESEKLTEDLIKTGEKQWEEINTKTSDTMKKWVENLEFVRKKDLSELQERIEILERRLAAMESRDKEPGIS